MMEDDIEGLARKIRGLNGLIAYTAEDIKNLKKSNVPVQTINWLTTRVNDLEEERDCLTSTIEAMTKVIL